MKNIIKKVCLSMMLASALALTGCSQTIKTPQNFLYEMVAKDASYFAEQMKNSKSLHEKQLWQLLYIHALYQEDQIKKAQSEFDSILPSKLSTFNRIEYDLLGAELALKQNQFSQAKEKLNKVDIKRIKGMQIDRFYETKIALQEQNKTNNKTILETYIAWEKSRGKENDANILDQTWKKLKSLSSEALTQLSLTNNNSVLKGWIELVQLYRAPRTTDAELRVQLSNWQKKHPMHPVRKILTKWFFVDEMGSEMAPIDLKIALLLPMSSQAKVFGNAIAQGFRDAMKENALDGDVDVTIYDTDTATFDEIMQNIQKRKDNMIVGPLIKNRVEQLVKSNVSLPVLALNRVDHAPTKKNVCYFSLAPEDEAMSAAKRMFQQNKRKPLLILPKGEMGERIAHAFATEWQKQSGTNNAEVVYFDRTVLANMSRGFLLRGEPLVSNAMQQEQNTMTTASQKADAVFIYAFQEELFLIKPIIDAAVIKYGLYNQLSIYASSRSHNAGDVFDVELDGVQFSEIPLIAHITPENSANLPGEIKGDNTLIRLYAMGKDMWSLLLNYAHLRDRSYQLDGETGRIFVDQNCVIHRDLMWLKYQDGEIKSIR